VGSDERRKLAGIIDEASTVIEARRKRSGDQDANEPIAPPKLPQKSDTTIDKRSGDDVAELLHRATEALPSIAVPPHAEAVLVESAKAAAAEDAVDQRTAPRIGEYALVARFPSSTTADVFLGYKISNFGFIRRAVVKWTDRHRYDYDTIRQKLLDEARAISFVDHPNIVSMLDLSEDELGTYVALEYVAGTDLRRVMVELGNRNDRVPIDHAVYVIVEVLRGLEHVHRARGPDGKPLSIIHRDVNPSNILISHDGHVKLTDFGAVLMAGRFQDSTAPGTVKGKVRYLAPEYITSQTCTHQVDIYSVGVMLFELITGKPVFLARDEAAAMYRIVRDGLPLDDLRTLGVAFDIQRIIERATMRDPALRFGSALEMCVALEEWMASTGVFVSPTRFANYLSSHGLLV
jgi:eukaryotic-like serine/threonine-protein kinase